MRKNIIINFTDMWPAEKNGMLQMDEMTFINERLSLYYDVTISKKAPQIVFAGMWGVDFLKYDCIRVEVFPEESAPNFNVYDYSISYLQDFNFKDRVYTGKVPLFVDRLIKSYELSLKKHYFTQTDLDNKTDFCSFVQSKGSNADSKRTEFFHMLNKYKKVNSGGKFLNNIGHSVPDKIEFERKHKFSISFINGENFTLQDRPGDAFAAQTIPIYWGNKDIGKVYNSEAFINCHNYRSFDEVIDRIIEIDNNDELYLKIMQTPAFVEPTTLDEELKRFDEFLINIVENGTIQRSRVYWNKIFEKELYYGRKKTMAKWIYSRKLQPVTGKLFSSNFGRKIKGKIIKIIRQG